MEKDSSGLFSERDRSLIEASKYDPTLKPNYNALSSFLIWEDEQPRDISPAAYDVLDALWLARAFLYHGYELPSDLLDPEYFRSVWDKAVASKLKWPGFNRLSLSEEDRQYYLDELNLERPEGI
jgi:hypothetical protein